MKDVNFSYNNNLILKNINFSIISGDYVGVIGPNGGGKTTLIKIILGIISPSMGKVKLLGQWQSDFKDFQAIGYVPQRILQANFYFPATVEEVIKNGRMLMKKFYHRWNNQDQLVFENVIQESGIQSLLEKKINELSEGQKQRVFIARSLMTTPQILILDEPFAGVDNKSQERFYKFLSKLNKNDKITIVMVSHDIDVITKEASRILCLQQEMICHLPVEEFDKEHYLKKLYGQNIYCIHHHH